MTANYFFFNSNNVRRACALTTLDIKSKITTEIRPESTSWFKNLSYLKKAFESEFDPYKNLIKTASYNCNIII